jgi:multidrug efflux pump subunit AcrB
MDSPQQIETVPLLGVDGSQNLLVRDVARVTTGTTPGQVDRSSMQRYVSLTANVVGTDLGRAAQQIDAALERAGNPPRGVRLDVRGQIQPMHEMFRSLAFGMALAVGVVLVMLTAYFESWRMAIASISSVPGVLCGVGLILLLTGSTLNIESFMGAIMSVGVSLSNSVMLISFIGRDWSAGRPVGEACAEGARERLRPILMTAGAMTMGMVPMALALERGSGMQAPLGRAVIGGLVFSTFITLLVVPAVFAALVGKRDARSASLHPNDPASRHFDEQQGDDSLNPKWASEEQPKEPPEEPREA